MSAPTLELDLNRALVSLRAWRRAEFSRAVAAFANGRVDLYEYRNGDRCVSHHETPEAALASIAAGLLRWKKVFAGPSRTAAYAQRGGVAAKRARQAARY